MTRYLNDVRGQRDGGTDTSADRHHMGCIKIDILPEELLRGVFEFCVCGVDNREKWVTLVPVGRRWQFIVSLASRRLDLRLLCTSQNTRQRNVEHLVNIARHYTGGVLQVRDDSVIAALALHGHI